MEKSSYPVNRAFYQELPVPHHGPPDPRFSKAANLRTNGEAKSSLHEALEILRHGKWYIIGATFIVLSAVALYTFSMEPEYRASTILMIDTDASEPVKTLAVPGDLNTNTINRDLSYQILILEKSLDIAKRTADSLIELRSLPGTSEPLDILTKATSVNQLATLLLEDVLSFAPAEENTDALEIFAVSNSAEEAAVIASVYTSEYIRETEKMLSEHLTRLRIFYDEEFGKKKVELEDIESRLASYMNREGAAGLDDQVTYLVAQIAQMEALLETARVELSMSESHLISLETELAELQPVLSKSLTLDLEKRIDTAQEELSELELRVEQIYRLNPTARTAPESNPELQEYLQRIAQLRSQIATLSKELVEIIVQTGGEEASIPYVASLKRKIAEERVVISGKQAQVQGLESRLREYDRRLRDIPGKHIELAQLERQQQSKEELFSILTKKLEEIRIAEESVTSFARVIRDSLPPESPEKPRKAVNLALGLILGLMLGVTVAVARRKFDTRVYSPEDLNHSDINMLGVVPDMRQLIKKEFGKRLKIDFEGREVSTALTALIAPMSPIAEAYRRLYIKLQFSRDEMGIQNLMVTSPKSGAGKSTTSLNLAFTSAQAGKRTLVIDADLRRPSIHDKLGLPEGPSLLELLSEDESRWDAERFFTGIENVYVITGIPVSQPAELLGSRRMMDLIDRFRTEFDIIIFDTPPVLGAVDPVLLSQQCDGVIIVASADGTDMEALTQSIDELRSVGANLLGTVLNRFDPSSMYGYKSTYGYSYGSNSYVTS